MSYAPLPTSSTPPLSLHRPSSTESLYKKHPRALAASTLALVLFTALLVSLEHRSSSVNDAAYSIDSACDIAAIPESTKKKVCDPHDLPGVLHTSETFDNLEGALETEWIPLSSSLASSSSNGSATTATTCPAQNYVKKVASQNLKELPPSLYNRTILLIGDSVDRANAQYSCFLLSGEYSITKPGDPLWPQDDNPSTSEEEEKGWQPNEYSERSYPTICKIPSIDLYIINIFTFGLDQENYFEWKDQYGPPYRTEDRIKEIAYPLVKKLGRKIDLLEFSSGLWDLARWGRQDDSLLTSTSTTTIRHLTLSRLQWYSSRFSSILSLLSGSSSSSSSQNQSSNQTSSSSTESESESDMSLLSSIPIKYIRRLHKSSDDDAGSFQKWWQVAGGGENGDKHTFYFPSWRIDEVNMAIEDALSTWQLYQQGNEQKKGARGGDWKMDHWGDKLSGMELFEKGNVHPHYAATTLWLEQMFYRLVNGQ